MANLVLKDKFGNDITYEGVAQIKTTAADGTEQLFVAGNPVTKEITVDFSNGNMNVSADENTVMQAVTIHKPETLISENVAKGINIAGILGTFEGVEDDGPVKMWSKTITGVSLTNLSSQANQTFAQLATASELPDWADLTNIKRTYALNSNVPIYILGLLAMTGHSKSYFSTYERWASVVTNVASSATGKMVGGNCGKNESTGLISYDWFGTISKYYCGVCVKSGAIYAAAYNGYGIMSAGATYQLILIKINPT